MRQACSFGGKAGEGTARCREKKARRKPGESGGLRRGVAKPREPSAPTAAVGAAPGPVSSILALQVVGGGAEGCRRRSVQQPLSLAPAEAPTGTESSRGTHSSTRAARPRRQAEKGSLEKKEKAAVSRRLSQTRLRRVNAGS